MTTHLDYRWPACWVIRCAEHRQEWKVDGMPSAENLLSDLFERRVFLARLGDALLDHDKVGTFRRALRLEVRTDGVVVPVSFFAMHSRCELRLVDTAIVGTIDNQERG